MLGMKGTQPNPNIDFSLPPFNLLFASCTKVLSSYINFSEITDDHLFQIQDLTKVSNQILQNFQSQFKDLKAFQENVNKDDILSAKELSRLKQKELEEKMLVEMKEKERVEMLRIEQLKKEEEERQAKIALQQLEIEQAQVKEKQRLLDEQQKQALEKARVQKELEEAQEIKIQNIQRQKEIARKEQLEKERLQLVQQREQEKLHMLQQEERQRRIAEQNQMELLLKQQKQQELQFQMEMNFAVQATNKVESEEIPFVQTYANQQEYSSSNILLVDPSGNSGTPFNIFSSNPFQQKKTIDNLVLPDLNSFNVVPENAPGLDFTQFVVNQNQIATTNQIRTFPDQYIFKYFSKVRSYGLDQCKHKIDKLSQSLHASMIQAFSESVTPVALSWSFPLNPYTFICLCIQQFQGIILLSEAISDQIELAIAADICTSFPDLQVMLANEFIEENLKLFSKHFNIGKIVYDQQWLQNICSQMASLPEQSRQSDVFAELLQNLDLTKKQLKKIIGGQVPEDISGSQEVYIVLGPKIEMRPCFSTSLIGCALPLACGHAIDIQEAIKILLEDSSIELQALIAEQPPALKAIVQFIIKQNFYCTQCKCIIKFDINYDIIFAQPALVNMITVKLIQTIKNSCSYDTAVIYVQQEEKSSGDLILQSSKFGFDQWLAPFLGL